MYRQGAVARDTMGFFHEEEIPFSNQLVKQTSGFLADTCQHHPSAENDPLKNEKLDYDTWLILSLPSFCSM